LLPYHVGSSTLHFALSDALVRLVEVPTMWWHSTERPSLILGPGQKPAQVNLAACEAAGVLVLNRQAGGTAVYAASGVLGLDIVLPAGHRLALSDVVEAYRWLGEVWVATARRLGADARLVSVEEARRAGSLARRYDQTLRLACFGTLSPYEVVVGDRKLVGLSQVRRRAGALFQAGIHLDFQPDELARVLADGHPRDVAAALSSAAIGFREAARSQVEAEDVQDAFAASLRQMQDIILTQGSWSPDELRRTEQRLADDEQGRSDRTSLLGLPA
jgi:lipoate-protein ligase A